MSFPHTKWPPHNPTDNLWDWLEKALYSGPTLPLSIQESGEKLMQHWMKINFMTLTLNETMLEQKCAAIKAKGGPTKY